MEQAKALKGQESSKSWAEAAIDSLGGREFMDALGRARAAQDHLGRDEVVLAGPLGTKIVSHRSLIENAIVFTGTPAVILTGDRPE